MSLIYFFFTDMVEEAKIRNDFIRNKVLKRKITFIKGRNLK